MSYCGTKVSVSVLSCMILLSVSQFNREAFGEWQWGCRGGEEGTPSHTHRTNTHTHTSALIYTDLCGLATMPVFVFDRKIDSLAGWEQPPWRIKTRKALVAVNHLSVHQRDTFWRSHEQMLFPSQKPAVTWMHVKCKDSHFQYQLLADTLLASFV